MPNTTASVLTFVRPKNRPQPARLLKKVAALQCLLLLSGDFFEPIANLPKKFMHFFERVFPLSIRLVPSLTCNHGKNLRQLRRQLPALSHFFIRRKSTNAPASFPLAHIVHFVKPYGKLGGIEAVTFSRTNRLEHRGGSEPTGRGRGLSAGFAHRDVFLRLVHISFSMPALPSMHLNMLKHCYGPVHGIRIITAIGSAELPPSLP